MKRVLCINGIGLTEYAELALSDGRSALDLVRAYVETIPDVDRVVALTEAGRKLPFDSIEVAAPTARTLLDALAAAAGGESEIIYVFGDTPFLDAEITERMLKSHRRYFAEYSFADGYPYGMTPEILQSSTIPLLQRLVADQDLPLSRETLFTIIQKDINSFDIETEISPADLRSLRVSLSCDTRRNYLLCRRLIGSGAHSETSLLDTIRNEGRMLRTLPAYANVQIIDRCPQTCSYCPFPKFGGDISNNKNEMSVADFGTIVRRIEEFAPDSTINLSLWGEPALHPHIAELVELVEQSRTLSLNIETSGIGWNKKIVDRIAKMGLTRIDWIVSLDAIDPVLYRALRGPGLDEAIKTAELLLNRFPGRVHIQAVRMNENEGHLEQFYRSWKEKSAHVIVQKYDNFAGVLPHRKVTDLSPLRREPCWHLKRDLVVLIDGTVTMCREDIHATEIFGNILTEELATIWERGGSVYLQHVEGAYPEICKKCDEYYTYNY